MENYARVITGKGNLCLGTIMHCQRLGPAKLPLLKWDVDWVDPRRLARALVSV